MNKKDKISILIASIIGLIIISISSISIAWSNTVRNDKYEAAVNDIKGAGASAVGMVRSFGGGVLQYRNDESTQDTYCVQHGEDIGKTSYTVKKYLEIKGNTITNESGTSTTSKEAGMLSYVISKYGGGRGYGQDPNGRKDPEYSPTQVYIWTYWETFIRSTYRNNQDILGLSGCIYHQDPIGQVTITGPNAETLHNGEAKVYADNVENQKNTTATAPSDNTDRNNISVTTYTQNNVPYIRVGPFNWVFNGNISNLTVYGDNDNVISNIRISKYNGNIEESINSDNIVSGQNFYITIRADSGFTRIGKIKATNTVENKVDNIYTTKIWILESTAFQNFIITDHSSTPLSPSSVESEFTYNITLTKDLAIEKIDADDRSIKLEGVGFIIQNKETGKYVSKQNNQIIYVDNINSATEFVTDKNGKIQIDGLIVGTYLAYETKNPNYGYEQISGSIEIVPATTHKQISNKKIHVKLSGFVWLDKPSQDKITTRNNSYDSNRETGVNGITVRLKDKTTNATIKTATTGELEIYSIINGGEYRFTDVLIANLANYYVEFEYDGLIYQSVATNLNSNIGSKATDRVARQTLDNNFTSVNSTGENKVSIGDNKYSITYNNTVNNTTSIRDSSACKVTAKTSDAAYNIRFAAGTKEIQYINLGIYEKPQADLSLTQDLETVNVGVNGYWHIYKYASRTYSTTGYDSENPSTWNVGVRFKNSYTGTYRRAIYQSDLDYETPEDRNKELQVYLTYKIALTNESLYSTKVNSIIDYFDNRYTLTAVGTGLDGQNNITGTLEKQTSQSKNNYNSTVITVNTTISSGKTHYIYVQFRLEREAVLQIMNNGETLSNIAEINSYTVYQSNGNTVAAIDRDSVPGNATPGQTNSYEDDTDAAPAIQLEFADARKIEGTVFVDSTTGELLTGQIRQGNGQFDNGETTVEGVKVTLHEINNSIADIETTTNANGSYELSGYIPGQYTITYTWGNKTYTVQEYKGTVYNSSRNQSDMYWYKTDVDTRYTDAIDNYQTRLAIDNEVSAITNRTIHEQIEDAYNNGTNYNGITITTMDSTTPTMEFGVEYETTITNGTANKVEFIVRNVDFGIVERARQVLDMEKRVTAFKITLANGQVLIDATIDKDGNLGGTHNYVSYMGPSVINGYTSKGFIRAEIDNELIEGSTLEARYEIEIINNSEIEYTSENYYKYGIQEGDIVTLTPAGVIDYLDKDLGFDAANNPGWTQITEEQLSTLHAVKVGDTEFLGSRNILYTNNTAIPLEPTKSVTVGLNVSKLLTTSEDLAFDNDAETVTITTETPPDDPDTPDQPDSPDPDSPDPDSPGTPDQPDSPGPPSPPIYPKPEPSPPIEVIPSTGEDRDYVLPIVIGVSTLIVLGVGVFSIKKFVISNK